MSIPQIKFKPSGQSQSFIEIIDLTQLQARKEQLDHDPQRPHRVGFNLLIYFEQGEGSHFLDFNHRPFETGSLLFVQKNQIQAFDFSSAPKGKLVLFTDDFIDRVQGNMKLPFFSPGFVWQNRSPMLSLKTGLRESCRNLLTEIDKEVKLGLADSPVSMHLFTALLNLLLREDDIGQSQETSPKLSYGHKTEQKLSRFFALLQTQYTLSRNAADYADQLHMTYKTLNQICKKCTNQSAKQLIDAFVILEAKRRLVVENKPIQLLSNDLGFDEVTNFVKYFKKHTLLTPTDFRRQH